VSCLHEWEVTAMFGLGTVGDCLAAEMGGEVWDIDIFFAL